MTANSFQAAEGRKRTRSPGLIAAAVLLSATAAFHLTGLPMAASWLEGTEGRIVELLWVAPAAGWLVIAAYWAQAGWRGVAPERAALVTTALLPLFVGVPLLAFVSPFHPGGYMLLGASLLAMLSGRKQH